MVKSLPACPLVHTLFPRDEQHLLQVIFYLSNLSTASPSCCKECILLLISSKFTAEKATKKNPYIKIRWSQTCKNCHLQWARCPTHSWVWGIWAFCRFQPFVFLRISTSLLYTQMFHKCIIHISSYVHRTRLCCFVNFHELIRTIHPLRSGGPKKGWTRIRHVITTL